MEFPSGTLLSFIVHPFGGEIPKRFLGDKDVQGDML
jgi:hypothetical protein